MKKNVLIIEIQAHGHQLAFLEKLLDSPSWTNIPESSKIGNVDILLLDELYRQIEPRFKEPCHAILHLKGIHAPHKGKGLAKAVNMLRALSHCMRTKYDIVFFLYGDDILFLLPLFVLLARFPKFGGLFFRQVFHYKEYGIPFSWTGALKNERFSLSLKNFLLKSYLKSGLLSGALFLDPTVERTASNSFKAIIRSCPDPIVQEQLQPQHTGDRLCLLFFGIISSRKGLDRILAAFKLLPPDQARKLKLKIAGRILTEEHREIMNIISELSSTGCEIQLQDTYISADKISGVFSDCDIVLLPYKEHVGSSNVLLQAAYWGVPSIVHNFGLAGYMTTEYGLGTAIDTSDPVVFSGLLTKIINGNIQLTVSPEGRSMAAWNSAEQFGKTIYTFLNNL